MSDHDAVLSGILDNPDCDTARLVYADYLQEQGDAARAEFIRVQVELAQTPECLRPDRVARCRVVDGTCRWRFLTHRQVRILWGEGQQPQGAPWRKWCMEAGVKESWMGLLFDVAGHSLEGVGAPDVSGPWPDVLLLHVREKYACDEVRKLSIAGALIAAEIDRLQRLSPVQ